MTSKLSTNLVQPQISPVGDEIDLRQFASALGRQKKLIALIAGGSVLLSGWYASTLQQVWQGQFQIVLEEQNSPKSGLGQLVAGKPGLANIAGLRIGGGNQLMTEVKILESPSVLKPTYDFVKASKAKAGENTSSLSFRDWRDANLKIELLQGTSVLNIIYRDTDQKLILPVVRKISSDYQLYSGRDRSKSITNSLAFIREQVERFRKRAAESSRALDSFSITYGISTSGESVSSSGIDASNLVSYNSSSRLRTSTSQSNTQSFQGNALGQLAAINQELIRRQQRFTSRDPGVLALIRERDALRRYIEVTAGGSLTLPGLQPATKEQAQEVILQFKELNRTAKRDAATLDELESSLLALQLEQARQTEPWELISDPTLLDRPVAPRKKRIVTLGLLVGLVLGCGAGLIRDRRSGLVFSDNELRSSLPGPMLDRLKLHQPDTWPLSFALLAQGPLNQAKSVGLIPVGVIDNNRLNDLAKALQMALGQKTLVISKELVQTRSCDSQILLVQAGNCSRSELAQIKQSLTLQGTPVVGWLLIDSTTEAL
ncbi:Wzz/FepE/Etk N-terminal domain-containing protein [Synechococcus sp. M16.1]|uniref:Wzz/FepE/Etk N-terminal domain-containing protein n=1 Tax=Synechococcus sp. M16.1 TaxID=1442553 RepID=UPI001645C8DD|nr:Wzz/FepE/Etk N-terminal domain-containing protein [Synechococcus sp. M16.1]QNJ12223.1 capsular exopolysaccharide family domain protein [Synechococcus sp. M16.1]